MKNKNIIHSNEDRTFFNFWCQGCQEVHSIDNTWNFNGDFKNPTFNPSIKVTGNRCMGFGEPYICHSFIENGQIRYLSDCTHKLAGKTIDLIPF